MILASTPESTPGNAPDPDLVTPGTIGFLVTFAVVIAAIFLITDALRRVRRVRARSGASDAYPIPLRKHVVPNQSTLSGPEDPKAAEESDEDSDEPEETEADASSADDPTAEHGDADGANSESEDPTDKQS
jgi:cytoskeletal protein RodZ